MNDRPTVAVIGAGFSGVLTALRLLVAPEGPTVMLIERGPRFGRGAAYATGSPHHLLNVRATNMSAFVEQPSHFLDWLGEEGHAEDGQVFVTRDRYGRYLQSLLREAASGDGARRLALVHDDVVSLKQAGEKWALHLGVGRVLKADAVVLATGNLPPPAPDGLDPGLLASPRYVADPWAWDAAETPAAGDILLLGTGLTAVDIALSIDAARPGATITALSRHGLLPRAHAPAVETAWVEPPTGSPRQVLARVRAQAREDWRGALDALRPHVQALWRGWSVAERRRFLRHARPWWDVHRHRLAPATAETLAAFQAAGAFQVAAGRLSALRLNGDSAEATWRVRGGGEMQRRSFALVVNCTGPMGDVTRSGDPLIGSLLAAGLVRPDACALGIDVDARSRTIGTDGAASPTLFAVGPITRGQFYEITSVPDIRLQAAECAEAIQGVLSLRAHPPAPSAGQADLRAFIDQAIAEIDVELASLKFAGRVRNAWELRGRRAALGDVALWLDERGR